MAAHALFAEVILPLAVEGTFTYAVPETLAAQLERGARVLVQFGKKKVYSGLVFKLSSSHPDGFKPKQIIGILDDRPTVNDQQFLLWQWMASYYMCTLGEVMKAALPAGLKLESESTFIVKDDFEEVYALSANELLLYEVIKDSPSISLNDISTIALDQGPLKILKGLLDKGAVETEETVKDRYRPRREVYIRLTEAYADEKKVSEAFDNLKRATKQAEFLELFLDHLERLSEKKGTRGPGISGDDPGDWLKRALPRRIFTGENVSMAAINALISKGIFESYEKEEKPGGTLDAASGNSLAELTFEQGEALSQIKSQFKTHQTILLQGVTSSGKTELYIKLISETIQKGRQVLYLLPEIALTAQMVDRLKHIFGSKVGVYHSKFSDSERIHIYRTLAGFTDQAPFPIILGVRSSLFLPFENLGLIIVDEEHEQSYKQHDPAPRYHARDAANILALYHGAKVLLGTATPSFESKYNALREKFGFALLTGRFGNSELPEVEIANTSEARRKKQMVSHFTPALMTAMEEALEHKEQIMLFQNRRGYTNFVICNDCGHIPKCRRCDVSLTYHKFSGMLECHYCGAHEPMHSSCSQCHQTNLSMKGFGTEKIEDELALLFEGRRIARLDTDTAQSKKRVEKIVHDFASGRIDILVGTQLISKGFDFENVSLVGVLDADAMLNFPDFRSFERSFQLIAQVSGRAGRRQTPGKVVIQTSDPAHPVIQYLRNGDYESLYRDQMEERKMFGYPPYIRMIRLMFKHKVPSILDSGTALVSGELKAVFGSRVLGPQYPLVRKVQNQFQKQIFLKLEREASAEKAKTIIAEKLKLFDKNPVYRAIRVTIDVDPL